MGFSRRIISDQMTIHYLLKEDLKSLYDVESIIITDELSSFVRDLFLMKKTEKEILEILNYKQQKEETTNEMSKGSEND